MSLAEVLIAAALFAMISTSIALLLKEALSYTRRAEARGELQRTSLFVLSNLAREVAESSSDCLKFSADPDLPGFIFGSPRGADDQVLYVNNLLQWQGWVGVFLRPDQNLLIRAYRPLPSAVAFKPNPDTVNLAGLAAGGGDSRTRVLARGVSSFSASGGREVLIAMSVEVGEGDKVSVLTTRTAVRPNH
jgi:hypothetical protein